jgi:glycerophosphoryl diester phosphodiesterase
MRRFPRSLAILVPILVAAALVVFALNTTWLAPAAREKPRLIAHRGLGQSYSRAGLTGETCTAGRIFPPEHPHIENTVESFRAAFAAGADIVEFDVHPTTDGDFVVFHDWTLDCRTDGRGVTREHDLAALKALDVGYGYTADGGRTWPFRGKGIGLMPTLGEILDTFPDRRFLINIKSNDPDEGRGLARRIGALPPERQASTMVYGGGTAIEAFRSALPGVTVLGTDGARRCLLRYVLLGWSGYLPADCRHTLFFLPSDFAPWMWGFPDRLVARLSAHGSRLVMLGPWDGSGYSTGVDTAADFAALPPRLDGYVWTNRIDRIGPLLAGD